MADRRRTLPSWMAKEKEKVGEKDPVKSRSKRKTARAVFYCMNEKELLETAVSLLTSAACEDVTLLGAQKVEDEEEDTIVRARKRPSTSKTRAKLAKEESTDSSDVQEMACVSETDLDTTELETVPYTKSPQHHGPEGQRSSLVQDRDGLLNDGLEDKRKEEHSQMPAEGEEEDDDALQLVREIFFS